MYRFLIKEAKNKYREVLNVELMSISSSGRKWERAIDFPFGHTILRNTQQIDDLWDIEGIRFICEEELRKYIKECRAIKMRNSRCRVPNYILKVNNKPVFDMKEKMGDLTQYSDEDLEGYFYKNFMNFDIKTDGKIETIYETCYLL